MDLQSLSMDAKRNVEPLQIAIRQLLEARDMTETELMAKARLAPSTVTHYLRGSRGRRMDPRSVASVEKMAQALDVPPEHFIEYRIWRCEQIMKAHPDLVDQAYDLLVAQAEAEEVKETKGGHVG